MSKIKYKYAKDLSGNIISINSVNKDQRDKYFCISCGKELIAKLGLKNVYHFAHKVVTSSCSFETYLHQLGKHKFCENYENCLANGIPYLINLKIEEICNSCSEFNISCTSESIKSFDLTKYYKEIQIEKEHQGFRPDILLSNSKGDVLYIEIAVTHKCEIEKVNSEIRIIEFELKTEDDLDFITNNKISYSCPQINLLNFLTAPIKNRDITQCDNKYYQFFIFQSGKYYFTYNSVDNYRKVNRRRTTTYSKIFTPQYLIDELEYTREEAEVDFYYQDKCEVIISEVYKAHEAGINIKSCFFCKYHSETDFKGRYIDENVVFCKFQKELYSAGKAFDCKYYRLFNKK